MSAFLATSCRQKLVHESNTSKAAAVLSNGPRATTGVAARQASKPHCVVRTQTQGLVGTGVAAPRPDKFGSVTIEPVDKAPPPAMHPKLTSAAPPDAEGLRPRAKSTVVSATKAPPPVMHPKLTPDAAPDAEGLRPRAKSTLVSATKAPPPVMHPKLTPDAAPEAEDLRPRAKSTLVSAIKAPSTVLHPKLTPDAAPDAEDLYLRSKSPLVSATKATPQASPAGSYRAAAPLSLGTAGTIMRVATAARSPRSHPNHRGSTQLGESAPQPSPRGCGSIHVVLQFGAQNKEIPEQQQQKQQTCSLRLTAPAACDSQQSHSSVLCSQSMPLISFVPGTPTGPMITQMRKLPLDQVDERRGVAQKQPLQQPMPFLFAGSYPAPRAIQVEKPPHDVRGRVCYSQQNTASKQTFLKLAVFDFDCTLSVYHVFSSLAGISSPRPSLVVPPPHSRTERGQLLRLAELDAHPAWGRGAFALKAFGGAERVEKLRKILEALAIAGVECIIISRGMVGTIRKCLDQLDLLVFFSHIFGRLDGSPDPAACDGKTPQIIDVGDGGCYLGSKDMDVGVENKVEIISRGVVSRGLDISQVIYIDDDIDEIKHAHPTCPVLHVTGNIGLNDVDFEVLRSLINQGSRSSTPPTTAPSSRYSTPGIRAQGQPLSSLTIADMKKAEQEEPAG